jgi:glycosyltransferase involved in cell wall biosynthesis
MWALNHGMTKKMNIFIINQYAGDPRRSGGTRHYSFAKELIGRGHKVLIVASSFDHYQHIQTVKHEGLENVMGVPYFWIRSPEYSNNGIRRIWNMISFANRVKSLQLEQLPFDPDVVIGSSPQLFAAQAGTKLSERLGARFVLEVRDLWPSSLIELNIAPKWHPFVLWLGVIEKRLYKKASAIITLLNNSDQYIRGRYEGVGSIVHIPNGIDLGMVPSNIEYPNYDGIKFLFTGSHGVSDGLEVIIEAMRHIEKNGISSALSATFIGEGPVKNSLIKRAGDYNLRNVEFLPPVPKSDIYQLMQRYNAFIVVIRNSSLYKYGFSFNKFYDYMAMGRPTLIISELSDNPFENSRSGITVSDERPEAVADAMLRFANISCSERRNMGKRARYFVEHEHDIKKLAITLESTLLDVVNK